MVSRAVEPSGVAWPVPTVCFDSSTTPPPTTPQPPPPPTRQPEPRSRTGMVRTATVLVQQDAVSQASGRMPAHDIDGCRCIQVVTDEAPARTGRAGPNPPRDRRRTSRGSRSPPPSMALLAQLARGRHAMAAGRDQREDRGVEVATARRPAPLPTVTLASGSRPPQAYRGQGRPRTHAGRCVALAARERRVNMGAVSAQQRHGQAVAAGEGPSVSGERVRPSEEKARRACARAQLPAVGPGYRVSSRASSADLDVDSGPGIVVPNSGSPHCSRASLLRRARLVILQYVPNRPRSRTVARSG